MLEINRSQERNYSDFGGLRINQSGLRMGDTIELQPFNGPSQKLKLTRTQYTFRKSESFQFLPSTCEIKIPITSHLYTEFQLILCSSDPGKKLDDKEGRYLLKATGANPFRINGNYVFEAFLEYGDIIELEYTRMLISKRNEGDLENQECLPPKVIHSDLNILIEGETGTGKTRLAKKLHDESGRIGHFVHINISSFSENLVESELFGHVKGAFTGASSAKTGALAQAHKGTLFIDEIDSLPLGVQTKLLLFLDDQKVRPVGAESSSKVNVRLIFSSGKSLRELVAQEKVRKDFFFRLCTGGRVKLKSLREDPRLITQIINEFQKEKGVYILPDLKQFYRTLPWPGNIRQLLGHLNLKSVLAGGGKISHCSLDDYLKNNYFEESQMVGGEIAKLEDVKRDYINRIYKRTGDNVKRTARLIGVSPNTVRSTVKST